MPTAPLPDRFEDGELVVRRWTADDAPALHAAIVRNVDHLRPWMPWIALEPQTIEQRAERLAAWDQDWKDGGDIALGVFQDGAAVGGTGLRRRIGPDGLVIGYWIDRDNRGQGLATRVARLLTTAAFTVPGITHVEIPCDQANIASRRVPEKLGFTHVRDVPRPPLAPAETGTQRVHRMTRGAWMSGLGASNRWPTEPGHTPHG
jgi:ribosomal-protein-serine acetyltransferase